MPRSQDAPAVFGAAHGLRYGSLGLPLAFIALPLYVVLPTHYATVFGVPLAALGAVLLAARLADSIADPWIGRWLDALFSRGALRAWRAASVAAVLLAGGFAALFFPPDALRQDPAWLLGWCALALTVTYIVYSVTSVAHQAWGARLGGDATSARASLPGARGGHSSAC